VIVDRVRLRNFRSYEDAEIAFAPGVTLFEGDIGSGKSSILFAIEFALFGLADVPGEHLLRAGREEGSIELDFRSQGRKYTVGRRLSRSKRGGTQQKDAYLVTEGVREELSVEQLRAAVIQVLGFREAANSRAKSQIFRYGIFTPQEEMKAILEQNTEERKQTLRRAFGIEEFKRARENADLVLRWLREASAQSEGRLQEAPRLEEAVVGARVALEAARAESQSSIQELGESEVEAAAAERAAKEAEAVEAADLKAERETSAVDSARVRAEERRIAARRELDELARLESDLLPLRPVAAQAAARKQRLQEAEAKERASQERQKDVQLREAALKALNHRKGEIAHESEILRKILDGSEEILEGQRRLTLARGLLETIVADHARVEQSEKRLAELTQRLARTEKSVERGREAEKKARAFAEEITAGDAAKKALESLEAERSKALASAGAARADLERAEKELEDLKGLHGKARCPKCKQPIDGDHLAEHKRELTTTVADAKATVAKARELASSLESERTKHAKVRDSGERAARAREALVKEATLGKEAQQEAKELERTIQEARREASRAVELTKERKRLEGEVREHGHWEKRAGEFDSARRRWRDVSDQWRKVNREIETGVEEMRKAREAAEATVVEPGLVKGLRAEAQEASEAAARLADADRKLGRRAQVDTAFAQAQVEHDAAQKALEDLHLQRARFKAQMAASPPAAARDRHRRALEQRAGATARAKGAREACALHERALEHAASALDDLSKARQKLDHLRHTRDFIEACFQPAMEEAEVQVLSDLNGQFNARFQDYFGRLMEGGPVDVVVDEEFAPQVAQGREPLPVGALSGGERTSIALAYRLALNTLVSRAAGMETPDLLILDEPTDGFSKEQLARVGELIRELDCTQVVLVSHERELESCADHVFEVVKAGTVSRVVAR